MKKVLLSLLCSIICILSSAAVASAEPYAELNVSAIQHICNIEMRLKNSENEENESYRLITAYYKGSYGTGQLISTDIVDRGTVPLGNTSKCFSRQVPDGCQSAKVFVWKNTLEEPLCIAKTVNFDLNSSEHLRMAIASDIHVGADKTAYCGLDPSERMQLFVDSVKAENEKKKIDALLITGDIVADGGLDSHMRDWIDNFASQLEMPIYYTRGNHDRYTPAEWEQYTGQSLQASFETDKYSFIMLDSYPIITEYENSKQYHEVDDTDIAYIRQEMENHQNKKCFIASHCFNDITTSSKIGNLASSSSNIVGLVYGHAHVFNNIKASGFFCLQTGSFFEPTYVYPTLDDITKGTKSRNLLGWRMLEEQEDNSVITYEVQPANYYPYWKLDYPYTIQQNMTVIPKPVVAIDPAITASGYLSEEHIPEYSADGDFDTYWSLNGIGSWIEYTFKNPKPLNEVQISFYGASDVRKSKFIIYTSDENGVYTERFNGQSTRSDTELESFPLNTTDAVKSVKLVLNGNTRVSGNTWNAINEVVFK